ncbi:prenyltransferase/squalene oxidase repeat-containing protein [Verrucomicrobiota bacterium]
MRTPIVENVPQRILSSQPRKQEDQSIAAEQSTATAHRQEVCLPYYSCRLSPKRDELLRKYGGGKATERAVLAALRWLKKYQDAEGCWRQSSGGGPGRGDTPAMTGLALLTFLAHGETPASQEFGPTVEKAIRWLIASQEANGHFSGRDGHDYTHPIATYALCEAYGLTSIPVIKEAAERATGVIVRGQNPSGMWNYNFKSIQAGKPRDDLSYTGWCVQALKAANTAGIGGEAVEAAMRKAVAGLEQNFQPQSKSRGIFRYTTGGDHVEGRLTGVGVLAMQLLDAANEKEAQKALKWILKHASCDWEDPWGKNPIYYWYFTTQARFFAATDWKDWNKQFSTALVSNQTIVEGADQGAQGSPAPIGYWQAVPEAAEYCKSYVYNTALCALMLESYYRYPAPAPQSRLKMRHKAMHGR